MENFDLASTLETIREYAILYVPKLLLAILTLIVGMWVIGKIISGIKNTLTKRDVDPSLVPFLTGVLKAVFVVMLIISVAGMIGIATTSFIAVLGAAGLAIGLALQGSLANFAGGVLILILKPFKVGDVIEAQGVIASVTEIQIFHTVLKSYDNKTIIIPNGPLYNDKIINYSTEPTRKVEWIFGVGYDDDIDKVKQVIKDVVFSDERILDRDTPYLKLAEMADSSVNFKVRGLVNQADFWDIYFEKQEAIKKAFDANGISIPFPQVDAHLFSENGAGPKA
ncbi:small conductance mechanosensitive channel [Catalinimonas alkaloidigena]|uniref:mechanosensitive ion channel family protein n=1 Tax=Catalinimonas alkaloidigena TaxID=1075417 RepID=UPI00240537FF|nr:mechanosensitive ion channel domain-containing protein [Catalinimonas alkaloidigena]MDF9801191.1 small conductance mechanosensitive channel [Catalinimonas alkaloidigena]